MYIIYDDDLGLNKVLFMYKQAVKETFCLSHDPSIKHNPSHQSPPLINPLTIEAMSDSRERSDRV